MDEGDYYFAAGSNAHDALNNILAAKGKTTDDGMDYAGNAELVSKETVSSLDHTTYAKSKETGNAVSNQFTNASMTKYDDNYTYLTRSDWTGSMPETYSNGKWKAPASVLKALKINTKQSKATSVVKTSTISKKLGKLTVAMLMQTDYDDDSWTSLIQQMSTSELDKLVRLGGYATKAIESTQLPGTVDKDGTSGISGTLVGGSNGMGYPSEVVIAATWNSQIAQEYGKMVGEDSLALGVTVWYAPATNIHRNPYGGRAFEYFSEDSYLSGIMSAQICKGAQSKGVIPTVKHFAINDQETNRIGVATFANEQSIRELYLKPFEMAVRKGNARAMMASMNRIGTTWTGGSKALVTNVLRNEWGFKGIVVTDQASFSTFAYEDMREGLEAGTDMWLCTDRTLWKLSDEEMTKDVIANMQRAAKNITYVISRSNAMNGMTRSSKVVTVTPMWQWCLYGVDGIITILLGLGIWSATRRVIRRRKMKEAQKAEE